MRKDTTIQPVFTISVDDPQKVGDPIRSFTMYTVHTRVSVTFLPFLLCSIDLPTDDLSALSKSILLCSPPVF